MTEMYSQTFLLRVSVAQRGPNAYILWWYLHFNSLLSVLVVHGCAVNRLWLSGAYDVSAGVS